MFSTLESSWDRSARRGWSAAASFTLQAMALSLLLAIPMFWVQGPPRLQWLQTITVPPMRSRAVPAEVPLLAGGTALASASARDWREMSFGIGSSTIVSVRGTMRRVNHAGLGYQLSS